MSVYDYTVVNNKGEDVSLEQYKGKVLLIVNTATHCGLTPQYEALETLYQTYKEEGFEILDFPCNQFMNQTPENDEDIQAFCDLNYKTTFPRFTKIDVNGKNASPLFVYLKQEQPQDFDEKEGNSFARKVKLLKPFAKKEDIKWNFGKFLVNRNGEVIARYSPGTTPSTLDSIIKEIL